MTSGAPDQRADAVVSELTGLAGPPSLAGTVQVDVTGAPDGDLSMRAVFDGGRVADAGPGAADGPDATLTLTWKDALAVLTGDLDPSVAFMQGRMKVAGDMGLVLDLLALAATAPAVAVRARVAALAPA